MGLGTTQIATASISGINADTPISISATIPGSAQYAVGSGPYTSNPGTLTNTSTTNSQTVSVQLAAANAPGTSNTATLTVGGISSTFTITTLPAYTIIVNNDSTGGDVTYPTSVLKGQPASIAISLKPGHYISAVTGTAGACDVGTSSIDSVTGDTIYPITNITGTCTITISYGLYKYTISSADDGNGTISTSTQMPVDYGTIVDYTLAPKTGYHVNSVNGNNCSGNLANNTFTITVTNDCTLTANFNINTYTVSGDPNVTGGSVLPLSTTVDYGTTTTKTITADNNYAITSVNGCGGTDPGQVDSPYDYTTGAIQGDCTVTATFTPTHIVTVDTGNSTNGSISTANPLNVIENAQASFTIAPNSGFIAAVDSSNCNATITNNTINTDPITADCTIVVSFTQGFTVNVVANSGGTVTPMIQGVLGDALASISINPDANNNATATGCAARPIISAIGVFTYVTPKINTDCTISVTFAPIITPAPTISVFAGNVAGPGYLDGTGTQASFAGPYDVAVDSVGNVYVAESAFNIGNCLIRKISPTGVVTTFAGTAGVIGFTNGTGSAASFYGPSSVAIDSADNLYVADKYNNAIRKITPDGVVTTFAGSGAQGSDDGAGLAASFYFPEGIAIDSANNVYVADTGNNTIRKITPNREVTTLAGTAGVVGYTDDVGGAASFNAPAGVAIDSAGNVYVADWHNDAIRIVTPVEGMVSTFVTAGEPYDIAIDADDNVFYVGYSQLGSSYDTIIKITSTGVTSTFAGSSIGYADGTGQNAKFTAPKGLTTDSSGNVYVADFNYTIRKITPQAVVTTLAGMGMDWGYADGTGTDALFNDVQGVTSDSKGNLFVADYSNDVIRKITPDGVVTTFAGTAGQPGVTDGTGADARFSRPTGIATDSADNLYVADLINNTIRKITPKGVVTTFAGSAGVSGYLDATGTNALFYRPRDVAVDSNDNVYVADTYNKCIRKIDQSRVVTTYACDYTFMYPYGITVDSLNNVFFTNDFDVTQVSSVGVFNTFAGGPYGSTGYADGIGTSALLFGPEGIAADSVDNLYVVDAGNNVIRKMDPASQVSTIIGMYPYTGFVPGPLPGIISNPKYLTVVGDTLVGRTLYITSNNGIIKVTNLP